MAKKTTHRTRRRAATSTETVEKDPAAQLRDERIAAYQADGMPWADAAAKVGREMRSEGNYTDAPLTNPNDIPVE